MENFHKQISDFSALVITSCENDNELARQEFLESFKSEAPCVAKFMKKGIHMVGFPDVSGMKPRVRKALEEDMEDDRSQNASENCDGCRQKVSWKGNVSTDFLGNANTVCHSIERKRRLSFDHNSA